MANWCQTYVILKTKNDEKALKMAKYFDTFPERTEMDSDKGWLGIILYDLGIESENIDKIETRGFIYDVDIDLKSGDNEIRLQIEDAWCPHLDPIRLYLLSIGNEDVTLSYQAEEPGIGLHEGYGEYNYSMADIYITEENEYFSDFQGIEYFDSEEETMDFLKEVVKFSFESIEDCVKKANEIIDKNRKDYSGDVMFAVNLFEEVHPQDITGNSDETLKKFLRTEII